MAPPDRSHINPGPLPPATTVYAAMSDPNFRSHKRQKSLVLNISYHFPPDANPQLPHTPYGGHHPQQHDYVPLYQFPPRDDPPPSTSHQHQLPLSSAPPPHLQPPMVLAPPLSSLAHHAHHHSVTLVVLLHPLEFSLPHRPGLEYQSQYYDQTHYSPSQPPLLIASYSYNQNVSPVQGQSQFSSNYEQFTPVKSYQRPQPPNLGHKANQLLISSHMGLFSLSDKKLGSPSQAGVPAMPQSYPFPPPLLPPQTIPSLQPQSSANSLSGIIDELMLKLTLVDAGNINNYLLAVMHKLLQNPQIPIDDFYNILYNTEPNQPVPRPLPVDERVDKTFVNPGLTDGVIDVINQILNVFKSPNMLVDMFPELINKENKLMLINYHELLRTFLAIKILFDMLIEMPQGDKEPLHYTIPRLLIYKTYYIICHKLILGYPLLLNTVGEQQKLILGQLKLGKLIKLVYPELVIKRLGLRGESKYNYLGVIWNDKIVDHEMKELCDQNELPELTHIFNNQAALARVASPEKSRPRIKPKQEPFDDFSYHLPQPPPVPAEQPSLNTEPLVRGPTLSFIKPYSKYPLDDVFTILDDGQPNWFHKLAHRLYALVPIILQQVIHQVFLSSENLASKLQLLTNFIELVVNPINAKAASGSSIDTNTDLKVYLMIIIELLPYLLLIKLDDVNINFLKNLRLNLLHLINHLHGQLRNDEGNVFKQENSTIFLIMLKKLINLNDLLITFIKLIIKPNVKLIMLVDIENFLTIHQQPDTQVPVDDDLFFLNLSQRTAFLEGNFSFRLDILLNDLVYTLIGYNFDPILGEPKLVPPPLQLLLMNFINQEISIIDKFFKHDLLAFLNETLSEESGEKSDKEMILTRKELKKLLLLINLIDKQLLLNHFKAKYPILIYNNFINFILNDILKFIFLKQQQMLLLRVQRSDDGDDDGGGSNSFGNWWVFNSFIQEYISLMGEIVGLHDSL